MGVLILPCLTIVALMTGLLCSVISSATACSCPQFSNRDKFCDADFAVRAMVMKATPAPDDLSDHVFEMKILEVFKLESGLTKGDKLNLTSFAGYGGCGVLLTEKTEYFLSRRSNPSTSIDLCDWFSEWGSMTSKEKKGVRGRYQCGLQIIVPA